MAGVNLYGELIRAQFQNLSSDDTFGVAGRIWWNTVLGQAKLDNGSAIRSFLVNDQKIIIGNNGTPANNVRVNRSAAASLQVLIGSDTTAEGSSVASTSWANLQAKLGGSVLDSSLVYNQVSTPVSPASGTNLLYFKSDDSLYLKSSAGVEQKVGAIGSIQSYTAQTSTYSILTSDDNITGDSSGGIFTMTLPAIATAGKKVYIIQKTDTSFNAITIARGSTDTIGGSTSTTLNTAGESIRIISDGTSNWVILERTIPGVTTSFTPTIAGFGTVSSVDVYYRRQGDSLFIFGRLTAGTVSGTTFSMTLPGGVSVKGPASIFICGNWARNNSGGTAVKRGVLNTTNTATVLNMSIDDYTTATSPFGTIAGNAIFGNGQDISFEARVAVTGWNG